MASIEVIWKCQKFRVTCS